MHDEIEVGSRVGEELIRLEHSGSGGYVLLANAYASRGVWGCEGEEDDEGEESGEGAGV